MHPADMLKVTRDRYQHPGSQHDGSTKRSRFSTVYRSVVNRLVQANGRK